MTTYRERRLDLAREVIAIACAMDMWVFGGYVRDVIVRGQQKFNDLDIGCPDKTTDVEHFLRVLSTRYDVDRHSDPVTKMSYGAMSPGLARVHKCVVRNEYDVRISIDVAVYDSFNAWCREHTVDFTCNIFYMKKDVALGIRYVPDYLKYDPQPIDALVKLTEAGEFRRLWDVPENLVHQDRNILRLHERAKKLVKDGFFLHLDTFMSGNMSFELIGRDYATTESNRCLAYIRALQDRRAVNLIVKYTGSRSIAKHLLQIFSDNSTNEQRT
jgi:hypothetical protein